MTLGGQVRTMQVGFDPRNPAFLCTGTSQPLSIELHDAVVSPYALLPARTTVTETVPPLGVADTEIR